jgi:hypothetical protein
VSANLDLVRSIYADWERGIYRTLEWADPNVEYVFVGGPTPGTATGITETSEAFRNWISAWEEWRVHVDEIRELDRDCVFVLFDRDRALADLGLEG